MDIDLQMRKSVDIRKYVWILLANEEIVDIKVQLSVIMSQVNSKMYILQSQQQNLKMINVRAFDSPSIWKTI